MTYFLVGLLLLGLGLLASRWYARASPHDLAQGGRTFAAVFSGLASTGLLFTGRFGLALITIVATFMAIRAIRRGRRGADPMDGGRASDPVEIETDLLRMRLDRDTGDVSGSVKSGAFAGSDLESLSYDDLLELLAEAAASDQQSASLLEAYLDRRFPDWRDSRSEGGGQGEQDRGSTAGQGSMDEAEALQVLGLEPGATADAIKKAHRRLMTKLHPDSGGSNFLATQINQAKDLLLGKAKAKRRR
jgi:hypothetical protein